MANLNLIKALAESKNIPITQLAQAVGVSEQQIHLMVRKNSTKIETLEKIARVLNVSVSVFFDEDTTEIRQAGRDYVEDGKIE
ncbi:helix-turn-helix domain-containing protein, partial [Paramuribaculum intestinale]